MSNVNAHTAADGSPAQKHVVIGAGQIGSRVAEQLAQAGHRPWLVSRSGGGDPRTVHAVACDATRDDLGAVVQGATAVYLAVNAAYDAKVWAAVLPALQERVLNAAAAAGARVVVLENLYMHGPHAEPLREDTPSAPTSKKGAVRTEMAAALLARTDLRVCSVRAPDFWGPGLSSAHLDANVVAGILRGKAANVVGDVNVPHARAYVDDVARTMLTLGTCTDATVFGRAWHAPVIHASTREMVRALAAAAGVADPGTRALPALAVKLLGAFVPMLRELDEMMYQWDRPYLVDDAAVRERFGLLPTDLATGAAAVVAAARNAPQRRAA